MNADDPAELHRLIDAARRDYDALLVRLEQNQAEFRRLARAVFRVQDDERRRIARELHDGVGQNLTAVKHQLHHLQQQPQVSAAELSEHCSRLLALVSATLEDTRQMARLLRPQILDDLGLEAALAWLVRSVASPGGPRIECQIDPCATWDQDQASLIFRLVQEALNNALKHAHAHGIEIELKALPGALKLRVSDDGIGFEATQRVSANAPSTGLSSMRERVKLFGGRFQVRARKGAGCTIEVILPGAPDAPGSA